MNNIIIIGAGGIGERHIRCFQRLVNGRVGLVESNAERREPIASRYGCLAFPTWDAANEAADWDLEVVAVPAQIHVPIALDLLAAGVDVLIEKPLAVTLEGLEELKRYDTTRTIRVAYVCAFGDHQRRFHVEQNRSVPENNERERVIGSQSL